MEDCVLSRGSHLRFLLAEAFLLCLILLLAAGLYFGQVLGQLTP